MQRLETAINVIWLLGGVAVCAYSLQLGLMGPFGPDSGYFPLLAGIVITLSGAGLLLVKTARAPATVFWPDADSRTRVLRLLGVMTGMLAAMPYLGFTLSGLLAIPLMMKAVGGCTWLYAFVVAIVCCALIHLTFITMMQTPLPRGLLGF